MRCKTCNGSEIIKLYERDFIQFKCKNGHIWTEKYIDQGGIHERPNSYKIELEDTLYPSEKHIYKIILKEIDRNPEFYKNAEPMEKTKALVKNCKINEQELYQVLKKITEFRGK